MSRNPPGGPLVWDPETLTRIHHLHLQATQRVAGPMQGGHRSSRVGADVEFADYKEYTPGDALKDLDWRVMARSDRLVVKRYEAETELACYLIVDASGDGGTGWTGRHRPQALEGFDGTKFAYGISLAATLACFLQRQQEPVGLSIMGGEGAPVSFMPARSNRSHLAQLFGVLASLRPGGRGDIGEAIGRIAPRLRRRSLVIVISDLMEEPSQWLPTLTALGRRRTDLAVFHLLDRKELEMDYEDPLILYSPEGGEPLPVDPRGVAPAFRDVVREYLLEVEGGVVAQRGRYYATWTDRPMEGVLRRMLGGVR